MVSMESMPLDIILEIIQFISPTDRFNLAFTCKDLYHRIWSITLQNICNTFSEKNLERIHSPHLYCFIFVDMQIGKKIQEICCRKRISELQKIQHVNYYPYRFDLNHIYFKSYLIINKYSVYIYSKEYEFKNMEKAIHFALQEAIK